MRHFLFIALLGLTGACEGEPENLQGPPRFLRGAVLYGAVTEDGGAVVPGTALSAVAYRENAAGCGGPIEAMGADTTDAAGTYRIHMVGGADAFEVQTCVVMEATPPSSSGLSPVLVSAGRVRFAMELHVYNSDSLRFDVTLPPRRDARSVQEWE